ncbi:GGDEF domain-containing protein [Acidovorax sp. FJL06]|nr:GGDEF domain-containing protein [Acidovorax sp. FJL06]
MVHCSPLPPAPASPWRGWWGLCLWVLMGLGFGLAAPWAQAADTAQPLVLHDDGGALNAWSVATLLPDPSQQWGVQDVLARLPEFAAPPSRGGSMGVRKEALWLRVPLRMPVDTGSEWIVNIDFAVLNEVDIFLTRQGQVVQHTALGNLRPYTARPLRSRTPAMALELAADTSYELLIRVQTTGAMILPITLSLSPHLVHQGLQEQMFQGVLTGLALCLVIYSLAQWLHQREKLFLYYGLLVAGSAGFSLQFFGIGTQFLWSDHLWVEVHAAGASGLLAIAGSFLFMGHALMGHVPHSRFLRVMRIGAVLSLGLLAAFLLDLIGTRTTTAIISVLGPLPSLISLPIAVARARKGDSVSTSLLAAWVAYFTAAVVMVCLVQGLLPVNFWTLHSFQLGAAADMLLFLRVLGQRSAALRAAASDALRERDAMRSLAYTDSLTGLPNRRGMQLALQSALARCGPGHLVAVYLMDLDGFKPVNDTYGHDVGDDLLVAVGHRLQASVRHHTDLVARLGGDEFIVMACDLARPEQAEELGRSLLRAFEHPFTLSHLTLSVRLTIGYALAPVDGDDPQHLIRLADAAMYAGKQSGKQSIRRNQGELALSS